MKRLLRLNRLVKFFLLSISSLFRPRADLNEVVISFTSYGRRVKQSWLTVLSILGQNKRVDIVMFLATEDRANMPIWLKMVPHIFRFHNNLLQRHTII